MRDGGLVKSPSDSASLICLFISMLNREEEVGPKYRINIKFENKRLKCNQSIYYASIIFYWKTLKVS